MRKIIFLDIDGVLAIPRSAVNGAFELDRECQYILDLILKATNAKIVISSSWRYRTLEDTQTYFKTKGFLFCNDIIGITPRGYDYIVPGSKLPVIRGNEIKAWVDTNLRYPWHANPEVAEDYTIRHEDGKFKTMKPCKIGEDYQYCIIDDDNDMLLEQKDNFVQTHPEKGLTDREMIQVIKILNHV